MHVYYFHGFNSLSVLDGEPCSPKVQKTKEWCEKNGYAFHPINLRYHDVPSFQKTLLDVVNLVAKDEDATHIFLGTSMGGAVALNLAMALRFLDVRALLLNPAIVESSVALKVGESFTNYITGEEYVLTSEAVEEMNSLRDVLQSYCDDPENNPPVAVMVEEGDRVLDSHKTADAFKDYAKVTVLPGGSHRFDNFDEALKELEYLSNIVVV